MTQDFIFVLMERGPGGDKIRGYFDNLYDAKDALEQLQQECPDNSYWIDKPRLNQIIKD